MSALRTADSRAVTILTVSGLRSFVSSLLRSSCTAMPITRLLLVIPFALTPKMPCRKLTASLSDAARVAGALSKYNAWKYLNTISSVRNPLGLAAVVQNQALYILKEDARFERVLVLFCVSIAVKDG